MEIGNWGFTAKAQRTRRLARRRTRDYESQEFGIWGLAWKLLEIGLD